MALSTGLVAGEWKRAWGSVEPMWKESARAVLIALLVAACDLPPAAPEPTAAPTLAPHDDADDGAITHHAGYRLIPHGHPEAALAELRKARVRASGSDDAEYAGTDLQHAANLVPLTTPPSFEGTPASEVTIVVFENGEFVAQATFTTKVERGDYVRVTQRSASEPVDMVLSAAMIRSQIGLSSLRGTAVLVRRPALPGENHPRAISWVTDGIETVVFGSGYEDFALLERMALELMAGQAP